MGPAVVYWSRSVGGSNHPRSTIMTAPQIALTTCGAHPQAEAIRTGFLRPPSSWPNGPKKARVKMTCHNCQTECRKFGRDRKGYQRYHCRQCSKTFTEPHNGHFFGMYIPSEKSVLVLNMLVEGMSIRSIERLTGVHRDTIMRLLNHAGKQCERFLDEKMHGFHSKRFEVDEIWTFVRKKEGRLDSLERMNTEIGDQYVFVALDADSKLIPVFAVGKRNGETASHFMQDLQIGLSGMGEYK